MAKKHGGKFCTIDHANKLGDRQRANPNRRLLRLMRAGGSVPDKSAADDDETRRVLKDSK